MVAGGGDAPVDFGLVGDVVGVNEPLLRMLIGAEFIPVLACLGADEAGSVYNINADAVASRLSCVLSANVLVLVTEVGAVLSDPADPTSRIARLSKADVSRAIDEGTITGGMIPKLTEGFRALDEGVLAVLVVGKLREGDLLRALTSLGSAGTLLVG